MRGTKVRKLRKLAFKFANTHDVGVNALQSVRHKNTLGLSFLKYSGLPRVYRDMKKSYTSGSLKI